MKLFKLPEAAVKSLTVEQIAVLAVLANTPGAHYNESFYCYEAHIANELGYTTRQVERIMKTLKAEELFTVYKERVKGSMKYRNRYSFPALDTKFILVKASIFDLGLEVEEIGTLIKLKAFTFYNGLKINKAKDWIGKVCGMGKTRFNRILSTLQAKGLVNYEASALTITCDLFRDNKGKVRMSKKTIENIKMHIAILSNRISNHNRKSFYQITDLSNKNISILLKYGLDKGTAVFAKALAKDFKGIRSMNNFIGYTSFGCIGYTKPIEKNKLVFVMP